MDWTHYCKGLEKAIQAGNATEHTHRPALKSLLESHGERITATNEPRRVACGAPDYVVNRGETPIGYIEAKDIGVSLDQVERSEQMARYLEGLGNLVLTDYLEFRWYVAGEHRLTARIGNVVGGKLRQDKSGTASAEHLLSAFFEENATTVTTAKELATRMAGIAKLIRDVILRALESPQMSASLGQQMEAFRKVLLYELNKPQFADMYAQTICYGLFAARCNVQPGKSFTREHAAYDLPKTNPFLRKLFGHIAGPELDEQIVWVVDDLASLLDRARMGAILKDFGNRKRGEDPVVHFYETFLAAYDPKMREARGVYYTPEAVVSYIVRSVDRLLKKDFKLRDGLADTTMTSVRGISGTTKVHKVIILDPATGTGTFLHNVIDHIHAQFEGEQGLWSGYVSEHLLPRLFGFEVLMAPYAVAHMKLGLQLSETSYDFSTDERLRVYLTNTLEEAHAASGLPLFSQWLAEEANAAGEVKQGSPVMVVLGNPPYSGHSENRGKWIRDLVADYKEGCPELRKPAQAKWLSDDYVKFIRFAQWRIERTGYGVLAFVTNHGYLDNPTFRGMRRSLMSTFDELYVLNLHGSTKEGNRAPDGGVDKNVFDIKLGVAIGLFVKRKAGKKETCSVLHADLWGDRERKYSWLLSHDVHDTVWTTLDPQDPTYRFVPEDRSRLPEYEAGWKVPAIFSRGGDAAPGIVTTHDDFAISWSEEDAIQKVERLLATADEAEARSLFKLCTQNQWQYARAKRELKVGAWRKQMTQVLYRPFDLRWTVFDRNVAVHLRSRVMAHMLAGANLGLITSRMTKGEDFRHVQITRHISEVICMSPKTSNNGFLFPLYLYDVDRNTNLFSPKKNRELPREANIDDSFVKALSSKIGLKWVADGSGDLKRTFGPEDVLAYVYAILHSPGYRTRYGELLKSDFPRIPLTSKLKLFCELCLKGRDLIAVQLLDEKLARITRYPIAGENTVKAIHYAEPGAESGGRVWINDTQYFDGVPPEVWAAEVGGYQVCKKWLKVRSEAGRQLSYEDLTHYQAIVSVMAHTLRVMDEIEDVVSKYGGWPIL